MLVGVGLAAIMWITVMTTPGLLRRRRAGAALVRLAMRLAGVSIQIIEPRHAARGRHVYVSNHASYVDVLVLITALPIEVTFVAKRELERRLLIGALLKRLGCVFVARHDMHEALAAARELQARLEALESLHVFPEGTFRRDPGLLPFHMGAFLAAAASGAAVVPVAVCGTRIMLPDEALLPRFTRIEVVIGEPVEPSDASWHAAVELREATRAHILSYTHERDLERNTLGADLHR